MKISLFHNTCNLPEVSEYRIESWVLNAIKGHVRRLEVNGVRQSKHGLTMDCFQVFDLKFIMPSVNGFHDLISLKLVLLKLPENPLSIVSSDRCSLRNLILSQCTGFAHLNVVGSKLESFELLDPPFTVLLDMIISCPQMKSLDIHVEFPTDFRKSFQIEAPNLRVFTWFGGAIRNLNLGTFVDLESASTTIIFHPVFVGDESNLQRFGNKLFSSLIRAKKLQLCCTSTQVLVRHIKLNTWICPLDVESLRLATLSMSDLEFCYTTFLLKNCPKLSDFATCEDDWSIWYASEPLCNVMGDTESLLQQLEKATLFILACADRDLKLMRFVLERAKRLRHLKILCPNVTNETEEIICRLISNHQPLSPQIMFLTCPVNDS